MLPKFSSLFCLVFSFFIIFNAQAVVMKIKAPAINGELTTEGLTLTDSQMTLSCRFTKDQRPGQVEGIIYPLTHHQEKSAGVYSLQIKSATYWEILPRFELKNCAYKLILIAKDKNQQLHLADFVLLGSETEFMDQDEFLAMKSEILEAERLFQPLHVFLTHDRSGRLVLDYERRQE